MNPFVLLAGIALGAAFFAATLWSLAQTVRATGRLRAAHVATLVLALAAIAAVTAEARVAAAILGALLALAAISALLAERRWNRLLPLVHLAGGGAIGLGLPFQ